MSDILNADEEGTEAERALSERYEELKQSVARGDEAARLLESPLIKDYFARCREQMVSAFLQLDIKADLERYRLQAGINTLDNVEKFLHQSVQSGEFSAKQLREISTGRKKRSFF